MDSIYFALKLRIFVAAGVILLLLVIPKPSCSYKLVDGRILVSYDRDFCDAIELDTKPTRGLK